APNQSTSQMSNPVAFTTRTAQMIARVIHCRRHIFVKERRRGPGTETAVFLFGVKRYTTPEPCRRSSRTHFPGVL
ncbi:hypothetical protein LSAT2_023353, partial [Lamellibrachia satsuma]